MTEPLYVFPDPRAAVRGVLAAAKATRWPTAVIHTAFPNAVDAQKAGAAWPLVVPWIQHGWDGTPSQEQQRQNCSIRVTVWTPQGKVSDGITLAQLVLAVLLAGGSASVWRFRDPVGPLVDVDPDTDLPFCSFVLTAETRPTAVA